MARQIEEMVDTGDLLFVECTCAQLYSENQIRKCFFRKAVRATSKFFDKGYTTEQPWDGVALVYRDEEGAQVICDFQGSKGAYSYDAFLALPFVSTIALRKLTTKDPTAGFVDAAFKKKALEKTKSSWTAMTDGVDIVKLYLSEAELGSNEEVSTVAEVEKAALVAGDKGRYSANIIVRTEDSKRELPNY